MSHTAASIRRCVLARLTYLQRRDNGVYYLQARLPKITGDGSRFLLRMSLYTREWLDARRFATALFPSLVSLMGTRDLRERMAVVSDQLLAYQLRPPRSLEELQSRTLYEIVGRNVMAEVNKGIRDVPPPENFLIFVEHWTTFVTGNIEAQRDFDAKKEELSYERGRRAAMHAHAYFEVTPAKWPIL